MNQADKKRFERLPNNVLIGHDTEIILEDETAITGRITVATNKFIRVEYLVRNQYPMSRFFRRDSGTELNSTGCKLNVEKLLQATSEIPQEIEII